MAHFYVAILACVSAKTAEEARAVIDSLYESSYSGDRDRVAFSVGQPESAETFPADNDLVSTDFIDDADL